MKISIDIDENLLTEAQEISGISNKKELIEKALKVLINIESQKSILSLQGKVKFYDDYL
nr:type II toxin-antitoxin system VapB family antitoxin [uncultured Mucilaginibacter sp.]